MHGHGIIRIHAATKTTNVQPFLCVCVCVCVDVYVHAYVLIRITNMCMWKRYSNYLMPLNLHNIPI